MAAGVVRRVGHWLAGETSPRRSLTGFPLHFVRAAGFLFTSFFLYGAVNGAHVVFGPRGLSPFEIRFPHLPFYSDHIVLPLYIFFTGVLIFLLYPATPARSPMDRPSAWDWIWCLLALAVLVDYIAFFEIRGEVAGEPAGWNDSLFGLFATLMALEVCRRVLGRILPALALVFFFYDWDWIGPYMPGSLLPHDGQPFTEVLFMAYGQEGIYGIITRVYANVVFLFIVFGAFLQFTRVGDVFVDLAFFVAGRSRGGAAKAAVVSSSLVGSVVGSGAANIAITGTFTIPLMKKGGYRPEYAGAVEAVASIGGHLMPPIMGSGAFLIAAFTETPYSYIALISAVPAILYYFSLFMSVHFHACRHGLRGLPREELPRPMDILRKDGFLLLPIAILIALIAVQFSPFFAAFWSLTAAVVCYTIRQRQWTVLALEGAVFSAALVRPEWLFLYGAAAAAICLTQEGPRAFARDIASIFVHGATDSLVIGATAGVMGIVLAGIAHSALGLKFPLLIFSYSYGYLWLALILTAGASYFLGMGMTITASYILIIILAGPALQDLGVSLLATHLIVYWLSQDAALTPPFALGAFVAAGIAQADPMRTGFASLRLAKPIYLVPVMMAYAPAFLMEKGTVWLDVIVTWVSVAAAFACTAAAMEGYLIRLTGPGERAALIAAGVLLMWYAPVADPVLYGTKAAGVLLLAAVLYRQGTRPREGAV